MSDETKVENLDVEQQFQEGPVADPVEALIAVTRPIFAAVLAGVSNETLTTWGHDRLQVKLAGLADVRTNSDGETGVSFEYAVHSAVLDRNPIVLERISDALKKCNITAAEPASILFAVEKKRQAQLLATKRELITPKSDVLSGRAGRPVRLSRRLKDLEAAFNRTVTARTGLPQSISGLWKADLFLGDPSPDKWVGTTVKTNPRHLEGVPGLRVAVIPAQADSSDRIYRDDKRNLIVCPMPYDGSFMQIFYEGRRVVQALLASKFKEPKAGVLTANAERQVARLWIARKDLTVGDAIDAMATFQQQGLLKKRDKAVSTLRLDESADAAPANTVVIAPIANITD